MIAFASRTGNVRHIVNRLALPSVDIKQEGEIHEPFLLFTYTDKLGAVPVVVSEFMERNHALCKGVIVSGNMNYGHANFGGAGDKLSKQYNIPLVCKIDVRGNDKDDQAIKEYYEVAI